MKHPTAAELRESTGPEVDHLSGEELVELYDHLRYQARLMFTIWTPEEMARRGRCLLEGEDHFDLPPSDAE